MTEKAERLQSLDALRGFDMLWIMGGARVVLGTGYLLLCWLTLWLLHRKQIFLKV